MRARHLCGWQSAASAIAFLAASSGVAAATVSGEVRRAAPPHEPVSNARVTVFDASLSFFSEARTDVLGTYSVQNVPSGTYQIGCAALGFEYDEQPVTVGSGILQRDFLLGPETNPGAWDIIGNTSPA